MEATSERKDGRNNVRDADFIEVSNEDFVVVCMKKIPLNRGDQAWMLLVRDDVAEANLIALCEQVLLSMGGQLKRFPAIPKASGSDPGSTAPEAFLNVDLNDVEMPTTVLRLEIASKHPELTAIVCYLGVNSNTKQRCVLIHCVNANPTTKSGNSSLFQSNNAQKDKFTQLGLSILHCIKGAFDQENYLVTTYVDLSKSPSNNRGIDLLGLNNSSNGMVSSVPSAANIDVNYVRDLQLSYAYEMFMNTISLTGPLDRNTANLEKLCAKLMTFVKPVFVRCDMTMPMPPPKRSVKDYPLVLKRESIAKPNLETSKLILFRAKKSAKKILDGSYSNNSESDKGSDLITVPTDYNKLVTLEIHSQLLLWSEEEASVRMQRRTRFCVDRIRDIENFRLELLWLLHTRYFSNQLPEEMRSILKREGSPEPLVSSTASVPGTSDTDQQYLNWAHSKCRLFTEQEPVLMELSVVLDQRPGLLLVSASHAFFEATIVRQVTARLGFGLFGGWGSSSSTTSTSTSSDSHQQTSEIQDSELLRIISIVKISIVATNQQQTPQGTTISATAPLGSPMNPFIIFDRSLLSSSVNELTSANNSGNAQHNMQANMVPLGESWALLLTLDTGRVVRVELASGQVSEAALRLADLLTILVQNDMYSMVQQGLNKNKAAEVTRDLVDHKEENKSRVSIESTVNANMVDSLLDLGDHESSNGGNLQGSASSSNNNHYYNTISESNEVNSSGPIADNNNGKSLFDFLNLSTSLPSQTQTPSPLTTSTSTTIMMTAPVVQEPFTATNNNSTSTTTTNPPVKTSNNVFDFLDGVLANATIAVNTNINDKIKPKRDNITDNPASNSNNGNIETSDKIPVKSYDASTTNELNSFFNDLEISSPNTLKQSSSNTSSVSSISTSDVNNNNMSSSSSNLADEFFQELLSDSSTSVSSSSASSLPSVSVSTVPVSVREVDVVTNAASPPPPSSSVSTNTQGNATLEAKRPNLARNIQAFLNQSQKK